ncbi:hypothetical protein C8R46DRAFT_1347899 [Mycena filopes]|nr:hypothetical protein C8R46DRAFT_1347899 [Mycena filopes]
MDDGVSARTRTLSGYKNRPIPTTDIPFTQETLLATKNELLAINDEIQALQSRRDVVLLNSRLAVYQIALAPHKVLPVDIISHIFTLCAPGPVALSSVFYAKTHANLILCQICSSWRAIALENLGLWNNVKIDFGYHKIDQAVKILPIWLGRARESTLSLNIVAKGDPRALGIVTSYAARCHSLVLDDLRFDHPFFLLPPATLGRLETMHLVGGYNYQQAPPPGLPTQLPALIETPLLRRVTLQSFHSVVEPFIANLPWRQLNSLYFDNTEPTPSQYYTILGQCEHVTDSRLDVCSEDRGGKIELSDDEIALPALHTLELNTDVLGNAARFLHCIALPALVDLTISLADDYDKTIFSVRSFPALQRLSIDGPGIGSQSDLTAWFRACPAVVDVWVPMYRLQEDLVAQIGDGRLLPRLQSLVLDAAVPAVIIAALEARQRSSTHSTITEVGFTGSQMAEWELENNERMRIARLRMVGVYMAVSPDLERVSGQIKKLAQLNAMKGGQPFASIPRRRGTN